MCIGPLDGTSSEVVLPGSFMPEPGLGQSKDSSVAPHHQLTPEPQVVGQDAGVKCFEETSQRKVTGPWENECCLGHCRLRASPGHGHILLSWRDSRPVE